MGRHTAVQRPSRPTARHVWVRDLTPLNYPRPPGDMGDDYPALLNLDSSSEEFQGESASHDTTQLSDHLDQDVPTNSPAYSRSWPTQRLHQIEELDSISSLLEQIDLRRHDLTPSLWITRNHAFPNRSVFQQLRSLWNNFSFKARLGIFRFRNPEQLAVPGSGLGVTMAIASLTKTLTSKGVDVLTARSMASKEIYSLLGSVSETSIGCKPPPIQPRGPREDWDDPENPAQSF